MARGLIDALRHALAYNRPQVRALYDSHEIVEEYFDIVSGEEDWSPRYNIAPTQPVPVIRQNPREPVR